MKNKILKKKTIKISFVILSIFLTMISCSNDDTFYYGTIDGRVERALNGEGIASQSVIVMTEKIRGSGIFSSKIMIDSIQVVTDVNGSFSASLVFDEDAFITVIYNGDDNYFGNGIESYFIDEPLIIKADKFIKFKIFVNNTSPFDENDYIHVDFFTRTSNAFRTGIENFGIDNTYHPEEPLPGGGFIGAHEEASWTGTNVNSIVYYSVSETARDFKIRWYKKKNNIRTNGFTNDIPYNINQINSFSFNY